MQFLSLHDSNTNDVGGFAMMAIGNVVIKQQTTQNNIMILSLIFVIEDTRMPTFQ